MVFQYAINCSEGLKQREYEIFYQIASEERRTKIDKYRFEEDKVRSLMAEIVLRYALCWHYKLSKKDVTFQYNEYGKPYLAKYQDIYFNISHSGEWVVCGIGDIPLGVDVEMVAHGNIDLAKRFFTNQEYSYIMQQPLNNQPYAFCSLWTLKESYIKAVGKGLGIALDSFRFEEKENKIYLYHEENLEYDYVFLKGQLDKMHCVALCAKCNTDNVIKDIVKLSIYDLFNWALQIE
ncbi:4'-phosphopantetheinyl transferase [Lachnotalea glycerini]|jgi:4'-phosphopantetheinyl transferase|uniref:4'-phosphopantetheinyl transferase n=1 Tax=Lachnotalea glycerini TaxID=1763509 RepID=A0A318ES11_9FIRM|nr:4'-phosphopantetheinyl transferase superfamily protein [Lachnotalea glycerini]PXV95735.1 4'-phosphopantetheinyl transferase [Lachnotalea glycerini]